MDDFELKNILVNNGDWSIEAEIAAKKILEKRGVEIDMDDILEKQALLEAKDKSGKRAHFGIQLAYFVAIIVGFFFNLIFTIAGIAMAFYYAFGKRVSKDGERHYIYDRVSRNGGMYMILVGILVILSFIYIRYVQ